MFRHRGAIMELLKTKDVLTEWLPDDGTTMPKHVGDLCLFLNVFYKVYILIKALILRICKRMSNNKFPGQRLFP
jgi:hypothetical protein